jgi:hypothetical protein
MFYRRIRNDGYDLAADGTCIGFDKIPPDQDLRTLDQTQDSGKRTISNTDNSCFCKMDSTKQ